MRDPFLEHEELAAKELEDPNFRFMKKKAVLMHQSYSRENKDRIEVFKKSRGLEIKILTWQQHKEVSREKCDEGHFHDVVCEEELWLETLYIPWPQSKKLAQWILDLEIMDGSQ